MLHVRPHLLRYFYRLLEFNGRQWNADPRLPHKSIFHRTFDPNAAYTTESVALIQYNIFFRHFIPIRRVVSSLCAVSDFDLFRAIICNRLIFVLTLVQYN